MANLSGLNFMPYQSSYNFGYNSTNSGYNPMNMGYNSTQYGYNYSVNPLNMVTGYSPRGIDQIMNPAYMNSIFSQSQFGARSNDLFTQTLGFGTSLQTDPVLQRLFGIGDFLAGATSPNPISTTTTTSTSSNTDPELPTTTTNATSTQQTTTNRPFGDLFGNSLLGSTLGSISGIFGGTSLSNSLTNIFSGNSMYNGGIIDLGAGNTNGINDMGIITERPLNADSWYGVSNDWSVLSPQGDTRLQKLFGGLDGVVGRTYEPTISPGGISWDTSAQGDIQLNRILGGFGGIFGT